MDLEAYISDMNIKESIQIKLPEFISLCENHHVSKLYLFGSSTGNYFNEASSDIDLLIEINQADPIERGEHLMKIWDQLEDFFQRKVDLLTKSSINNPILKRNIDATKVLIYDGAEQKISL